jgi:hypothetical protein
MLRAFAAGPLIAMILLLIVAFLNILETACDRSCA